jgi:hypothetical protein
MGNCRPAAIYQLRAVSAEDVEWDEVSVSLSA